jgi:hypothetical protein
MSALVPRDLSQALSLLDAGKSLREVAPLFGLSYEGLRKWLLKEVGPEYESAQTEGLLQRVIEADQRLESADNAVDIARAREVARFARMDLERRRPRLYGQQQQLVPSVQVAVQINLKRGNEATKEAIVHSSDDAEIVESKT